MTISSFSFPAAERPVTVDPSIMKSPLTSAVPSGVSLSSPDSMTSTGPSGISAALVQILALNASVTTPNSTKNVFFNTFILYNLQYNF